MSEIKSIPAPRTRLVWHTAEIVRTACALGALAVIGVVGMFVCYGGIMTMYAVGTVLMGG